LKTNTLNKKTRILQVIDVLHIGGAEQICILLSNLLKKANYDVSLLLLTGKGAMYDRVDKSVYIYVLNKKSNLDIFSYYQCAKIIKQYDIIHVHMRYNFKYIKLVKKLFRIKNKLLLHDHFGNIEIDKSIPFLFKSFFRPHYYIGVSDSLVQWARNRVKIDKKNTYLLLNTVAKVVTENYKNEVRKGIVLVANIKPVKNQLEAIRMMPYLDTTLTIYGNIQDIVYYNILLQEIENLQVSEKVKFVHGNTNIQVELQKYSIAIMPSLSESGPLVLIEYLAQDLPFVSYKTGEVSSVLEKEFPLCFINTFEIEEWVKKISTVLDSNYNFSKAYNTYFSEYLYLKKCLNIYQQIKHS
jgi:glycosyltransferase involved in cell wall biosynthesis